MIAGTLLFKREINFVCGFTLVYNHLQFLCKVIYYFQSICSVSQLDFAFYRNTICSQKKIKLVVLANNYLSRVQAFNNYHQSLVHIVNPLHPKSALIDFVLSNPRRFYYSKVDSLGLKVLSPQDLGGSAKFQF